MTAPAVSLQGVRKRFTAADGSPITAVAGVSLTIHRGEVVAFLGPNGAGKTTTIDVLLGLTRPDDGRVALFGRPPLEAVQSGRASAVLQSGGLLPELTVEATVRMMASLHESADPELALHRAGLDRLRARKVSKCSGGEQQRLRFALALLPRPELLVLDEPTAGMDVEARHEFWAAVREDARRGLTVLFATHYLEEADDFADRVVMIDRGTVVADGSAASLRASVEGRTVSARLPEQQAREFAGRNDLRVVDVRGERVWFEGADSDELLRRLVLQTSATEIESTPRSLEDAFLRITGRAPATTGTGGTR